MSLQAHAGEPAGHAPTWLAWNLAATTLISAFLLFQVQPLICKAILPWFGGSPAVWSTGVLFFQTLLFCGYAYAHFSEHLLGPRAQAALHLGLIAAALASLPILPGSGWKPLDGSDPTWRILGLLAFTVGMPYFILSSTGPLVQAWFARAYPAASPYRLYALSNVGSLAALISYPFLFEPIYGVGQQAHLWSGAFLLFAASCGLAVAWNYRHRRPRAMPAPVAGPVEGGAPPQSPVTGPFRRILWLALPALASLMLLAATNHVCQDVAAIPFLWIVPLGLYLLSFILCFDRPRWYRRGPFAAAAALAVLAVAGIGEVQDLFDQYGHPFTFVHELILYFSALFLLCMVCHGELVRMRPGPRHLTEFYLMVSAGGALGGVFVSLISPQIFSTYLEWVIGLVVSYVLAVSVLIGAVIGRGRRRLWPALAGAMAAVAGLVGIVKWQSDEDTPVAITRNFYGVVSVWEVHRDDPERHRFSMLHGRVSHGRQFASPDKRRIATTYYHDRSGVGRALDYLGERGPLRVGAVGLGVGTLATYARPGDDYRFYEINPEVLRLARAHFTYLADCKGTCEVAMGDARLSLGREAPQGFDVLILDAFSGDSIPTHLLTVEAFDVYRRHLEADGVLAVHITNSYLNLAPVVRRLGDHFGLKATRIYSEGSSERLTFDSDWMLLTRDEALLAAIPPTPTPRAEPDPLVPLWTDQYSNLFQILLSE